MRGKRLWPWLLSIALLAGLATLVVVLVERAPTAGDDRFEEAATPPARTRATRPDERERAELFAPDVSVPSLAGKTLARHEVAPSTSATTIQLEGHVAVTIPPDLLDAPRTLVIAEVPEPPPPAFPWLRQAPVYDISLGDLHELDRAIDITLPFDPSWLVAGAPPEAVLSVVRYDPSQGVWVQLPSRIDLDAHTITGRTDHLSAISIQVWRGGESYELYVDGDFIIYYDHQEVRGLTVPRFPRDGGAATGITFAHQDLDDSKMPASSKTIPGYIAVVRDAARAARAAYKTFGLELRTRPLHIHVGGVGSSAHSSLTNTVTITCQALDEQELRYAVAHEMFHNVQARYYTTAGIIARRWWMEATAEYAAARIAVPGYRDMGKLNELRPPRMPPRFLEQYLTYAPTPRLEIVGRLTHLVWGDDPYQYHAYQGAYFLEHLARRAIDEMNATGARIPAEDRGLNEAEYFARTFKAVATGGLETMPALDDFLTREHGLAKNLAGRYADFVLYYLFDPASPMPPDATDASCVNAAALDHASVVAPDGTVSTHTFDLVGGHSAKVWEVRAPAVPGQDRTLEVKIDGALPGFVTVYLVRLRDGHRRAGVAPEATFDHGPSPVRATRVTLNGDERLYLVAINDWRFDESVSLRVWEARSVFEQARLDLSLGGPADVVWGDGRAEAGAWEIDLVTTERPLTVNDRDFRHEVHFDKPRDEKVDLSLTTHADPFYKTLTADLTVERTFESFDESGQDPRVTGGGKQRCVVKGLTLELVGTYDNFDGRTRWSWAGRIPASAVTECSHTSHRSATRLASGDPVPHMSFTKTFKAYGGGNLTLDAFTRAATPP